MGRTAANSSPPVPTHLSWAEFSTASCFDSCRPSKCLHCRCRTVLPCSREEAVLYPQSIYMRSMICNRCNRMLYAALPDAFDMSCRPPSKSPRLPVTSPAQVSSTLAPGRWPITVCRSGMIDIPRASPMSRATVHSSYRQDRRIVEPHACEPCEHYGDISGVDGR
jgi:hypothetical protein